jgi:DNA repair exonuclease SbcCD ATPase subunit
MMPLNSPPVQPPPPLPDGPDFELDPADAAAKELWQKRITQLANIVEAAQEEHVLSKNVKELQTFTKATFFHEELRSQYQTKLSEVEAKQAAQKAQCDGLIQELIRSDNTWPMSQVQMERDAKLQEKYDEMVQYVNELKGIAGEMGKALQELGIEKPPPPPVPPVVSQEQQQDAMDVDEKPAENRGLSEKEYDTILDKLAELESQIGGVQNEQVQNERDTREEMLDLIERRLKEFKDSLANEDYSEAEDEDENAMQEDAPETLGQLRQRVAEIAQQTTTTDTDLTEVSSILEGFHSETANLTSQLSDALQDYHSAQEKQNQVSVTIVHSLLRYSDIIFSSASGTASAMYGKAGTRLSGTRSAPSFAERTPVPSTLPTRITPDAIQRHSPPDPSRAPYQCPKDSRETDGPGSEE